MAVLHISEVSRRSSAGPALDAPAWRAAPLSEEAPKSRWPMLPAPSGLHEQAQRVAAELLLDSKQKGRVIGVTSPLGGEGKTLLSAVIAWSLAHASDRRTVLIEGTWRRPTMPMLFDLPSSPGLAEWLRGECAEASIRHRRGERLVVIPAGIAGNEELVLLERLKGIGIAALAGPDDFVIVDLPSVLSAGAGRLAAELVDRIIVVARAGVTPLPTIVDTCDQLSPRAIQGIILNQVTHRIPRALEQLL